MLVSSVEVIIVLSTFSMHACSNDFLLVRLMQEIVDSMIEHSSTFKARTKFSQEKYIKKKERK